MNDVDDVFGQLGLRLAENTGENDRQQPRRRIAGPRGDPTLHIDTAERAMVEIGRQLPLLGPCPLSECSRAHCPHFQRHEIGEHAQHAGHLGRQGPPVADRQVRGDRVFGGAL